MVHTYIHTYVRIWPLVQVHCYGRTYILRLLKIVIHRYSMYIRTCYAHCVYRKPTLADRTLALVSLMIIDMYMYPLNVSNFYCVILYIRTSYCEIVQNVSSQSPAAGWRCGGGKELFKGVTLIAQSKCYRSLRSCKGKGEQELTTLWMLLLQNTTV